MGEPPVPARGRSARIAALSVPYLQSDGIAMTPDGLGTEYLTSLMPMVAESVDRLDQVPRRLRFLFHYDPRETLALPGAQDVHDQGSRLVLEALARELSAAPRLDRERFRAVAAAIGNRRV